MVHLFCILKHLTVALGTLSLCRQVGPEPMPGQIYKDLEIHSQTSLHYFTSLTFPYFY